ncbi:hypothetical protein N7467_012339 [Penicillium canescens]|nr:hypothetical protein N7467_012339 [Penicillium canescens]
MRNGSRVGAMFPQPVNQSWKVTPYLQKVRSEQFPPTWGTIYREPLMITNTMQLSARSAPYMVRLGLAKTRLQPQSAHEH